MYVEAYYHHGVLDGILSAYYPNQNLKLSGKYSEGDQIGLWQYWYENGQLRENRFYIKEIQDKAVVNFPHYQIYNAWTETGEQTVKDGNGFYYGNIEQHLYYQDKIYAKGALKDGFRTGLWTGTRETVEKYYEEEYVKGLLIKGTSYDLYNNTYEYTELEKYASPKDGMEALYREINEHLVYPKSARRKGIEARVIIQFVVNKTGNLEDIKVLKGISPDCDQAAVDALKKTSAWKPDIHN
ncbi:MAG: TonB family protein [Microscillaceae bacterium]|nr:TonB family protein [Microscillaceae bacterium]